MNRRKDIFQFLGEQISRFFRRPGRSTVPVLAPWQEKIAEWMEYDLSERGVLGYIARELNAHRTERSDRPFTARLGIAGAMNIDFLRCRLALKGAQTFREATLEETLTRLRDKQGRPIILRHAVNRYAELTPDALLPETQNAIEELKKTRSQRR